MPPAKRQSLTRKAIANLGGAEGAAGGGSETTPGSPAYPPAAGGTGTQPSSESGTPAPGTLPLSETLSFLYTPMPFKNQAYFAKKKAAKSAKKTLKAVMNMERERGGKTREDGREIVTFLTPQAPPSLLPAKKYCDITGLPAKYTDPKTKLRYCGLEVWDVIRTLGPGQDQAYLATRGANHQLM